MDDLVYVYEDTFLRLDDSVIEVFRQLATGSQRTPLVWAGAVLEPKKNDQLQVTIGAAQSGGFYCSSVTSNPVFSFTIPASEGPRLRSFLDEAARRSGGTSTGPSPNRST